MTIKEIKEKWLADVEEHENQNPGIFSRTRGNIVRKLIADLDKVPKLTTRELYEIACIIDHRKPHPEFDPIVAEGITQNANFIIHGESE